MRWLAVAIVVLAFTFATAARAAIDPDRINRSLARAKDYLYKQQKDGHWDHPLEYHGDQKTGHTALVIHALLSAGESHTDPRIVQGVEYLKKTDTTGIYALGVRCQVWLMLPQTPEVKRMMHKDATAIRKAILMEGEGKGFYEYNPGAKYWSRSRAQYAVLGMWAAAQAGFEVDQNYWRLVEQAWIDSQDPSGAWNYLRKPTDQYPLTPGMTAVGVATLYITQDYLQGNVASVRGNPTNPHIDKGMKWMIDNFDKVATDEKHTRDFQYATVYSVERIGVASGLKRFGTIDWYDKCAGWLLEKQFNSGAWPSEMGSNLHSTCFAVLTLARGRAPIAINKLNYAVEGARKVVPWNQRPRDAANVSRWIGRQLERDLNWQILDLQAPVDDWHDAPIVYMSGNEEFALDEPSRQKVRTFLEQGGLILGNADVNSRLFANSFRRLGQELFGDYEFRELPETHVIYSQQFQRKDWKTRPTVLGLSNGVRELMILLPQGDLGRSWQIQNDGIKREHWELASNILLYCADAKNLRTRGQTTWIARNDNIKATRTVKLARLKYNGNWDPEPGGWKRLANLLHNRDKIDVEIISVDLDDAALEGFKIAHLTGTLPIKLDNKARQKLKAFVDGGGTLLIDAGGGSAEFANAIEQELATIFPGTKLSVLPKDHALFGAGGAALKSFGYRPFASRMLGALKDEPRLRAIDVNGRPAVLYSREDLGAGLVGQYVDGVIGYDPPTATEIAARIVLHAAVEK